MTLKKILQTISVKEWWFVFAVSLTMILATSVFLFFGLFFIPSGKVFTGIHFSAPNDWFVYYSYIEQAVQGKILFDNLFAHEPHLATFNPLWLAVGLMAKAFNLSGLEALNAARILLIPCFYVVFYIFLAYLFADVYKRQVATLLASFASGLGFFLIGRLIKYPFNFDNGAFQWPMDLWVPEMNTFLTLYYSPHFIASLILIIAVFFLSALYVKNKKSSYTIASGLLAALLFSFHPFHVPTIFGVLLAYYAAIIFRDSKIYWHLIRHYILLFLISAPVIFYYLYLVKFDFVMGQKAAQNLTLTTPVWITFFSYGLLGIFAIAGIFFLVKEKKFSNKSLFIIVWAVVQSLLIYFPINYQRRLTEGLQIPLTILATIALFVIYQTIKNKKTPWNKKVYSQRYVALFTIGALFIGSNIFQLASDGFIYANNRDLAYLDKNFVAAAQWLKSTPQNSIIFNSADGVVNTVPAYSGRFVYVGHGVETPLSAQKQAEVDWFFAKNRDEENEKKYLDNRSVDYIFYSSFEKQLGIYSPDTKRYLEKVYSNSAVTIYKVL